MEITEMYIFLERRDLVHDLKHNVVKSFVKER